MEKGKGNMMYVWKLVELEILEEDDIFKVICTLYDVLFVTSL